MLIVCLQQKDPKQRQGARQNTEKEELSKYIIQRTISRKEDVPLRKEENTIVLEFCSDSGACRATILNIQRLMTSLGLGSLNISSSTKTTVELVE